MNDEKKGALFQREIKDHWYVKFNEQSFPHIQQAFVLPPERMKEFDPFILLAEDWFKRGTFPDHPHCGFQTITYVIDGRLEHVDNHGGHSVIEAGDIQYMNAGKGARHAEEPVGDDITHSLQLWLNLPKQLKGTDAYYKNIYSDEAPKVSFDGGFMRLYSGEIAGKKGPLEPLVPFTLSEITLKADSSYAYELPESHNAFVYVLSGDLDFGQDKTNLKKTGVGIVTFKEDTDTTNLSELYIKANTRSKILVYSGKQIKEEIVARGPFVMNTVEEIHQAYEDYHKGKFGHAVKSEYE